MRLLPGSVAARCGRWLAAAALCALPGLAGPLRSASAAEVSGAAELRAGTGAAGSTGVFGGAAAFQAARTRKAILALARPVLPGSSPDRTIPGCDERQPHESAQEPPVLESMHGLGGPGSGRISRPEEFEDSGRLRTLASAERPLRWHFPAFRALPGHCRAWPLPRSSEPPIPIPVV